MSLLRCAVNTLFSLEKLCENGLFSVRLAGPATVVSVAYVTRGTGGLTQRLVRTSAFLCRW